MLNRRSMFGVSAAVAVSALPVSAIASQIHPGHDWFIKEARDLIVMTDHVNAGAEEAFCDAWSKRLDNFITKVERLPITKENAAIKALAITVLHCDEPQEWTMEMASDMRLAGQMVQCLTGGLS